MEEIIRSFGLDPAKFDIKRIPTGYINNTFKLAGPSSYILQRVNVEVFKKPGIIAENLRLAAEHLKQAHPNYLFLSALPTTTGDTLFFDKDGYPWRLFAFIENSITIDRVETEKQAYSASEQFARLTRNLEGVDVSLFKPTIERFHDLSWRYEQFEDAVSNGMSDRKASASDAIEQCRKFNVLVKRYQELIRKGTLQLRITHNDTKINNILFDSRTMNAICVIDLDTLMPGYFIYDAGDMVRTFVSPVSEEEKNLEMVVFRKNIYEAVVNGYLSQMGDHLTTVEKTLFPYAGKMMTYIMALRMLADYLQGDVYYQITYPEQNIVRARNQLRLLEVLSAVI